MKFSVVSLLLLLLSPVAYSACDAIGCTTKLKRVYISGTSDGRIFIEPVEKAAGIVECTMAEGKFFTLKKSHPLHSEIYSALLASVMASKPIRMRIVKESSGCELNYVWITGY